MKKILPFFLVSIFFISCKDVKEPVFEQVENLKMVKPGLVETAISASLRFNNQNSFPLQLKKLECDLYVDSIYTGHFTNTETVNIPANQSFLLPLSGNAQNLVLMRQTQKGLQGLESHVRVEGTARVGRSGFYKTIPFHYSDTVVLSKMLKL